MSADLSTAYYLKENFFDSIYQDDIENVKKSLSEWIMWAQDCGIKKFSDCAKTYVNRYDGIINSLKFGFTNGSTEGCNNKIKVLKRNAYGYKNFKRFRNRILHIFYAKNNKLAA